MTKRKKDQRLVERASTEQLHWKVHTPNLMNEILSNPNVWVLKQPLMIFFQLLQELASHAIKLNDPKLNLLMARLTLYDQADPSSPDFEPELIEQLTAIVANSQKVEDLPPERVA